LSEVIGHNGILLWDHLRNIGGMRVIVRGGRMRRSKKTIRKHSSEWQKLGSTSLSPTKTLPGKFVANKRDDFTPDSINKKAPATWPGLSFPTGAELGYKPAEGT
jgi:hypothetical protein